MTTPVYILYAEGHRSRGSVIMRALQLAALGNDYLSQRYVFQTLALPRKQAGAQLPYVLGMRGGVVILQKALAEHMDEDAFHHLKVNNIAIAADWIDKVPKGTLIDDYDFHIAASRQQWADLRKRLPDAEIRHLTHHSDPRLRGNEATGFGALYLGHAANATLPEGRPITLVDIRKEQDFAANLRLIQQFPFHYAVRDSAERPGIFKPFTKGFTAAACDANMLVQRDAHDAVDYLGDDYPYLIEGSSPAAIQAGFDFAQATYGGPVWERALSVMADVQNRSSPRAVAHELAGILQEVVGRRSAVQVTRRAG